MYKNNSVSFLLCVVTLFLFGVGIFLVGFFPISYLSVEQRRKNAELDTGRPTTLDGLRLHPPPQKYEQTILMLVDALRYDFATRSSMPFSYDTACSCLKLRVDVPTVTMPRLKSIATGTLYNFVDIILNLGRAEPLEDSLLHGINKRGDAIVFAGDLTWVNLFPSEFRRAVPIMDSFFVGDFYQGDSNVTRVLGTEMENTDWILLILHYLGLDHIGHVEGSTSLKIPGKLMEMDEVIKKIYNSKRYHDQLILLTGDHGMRNGGGHGGSTTEELYVPLFTFEENCIKKSTKGIEYRQIDLAPTLAILFSIEIPRPSIGCLISELLQGMLLEDQLYAYYYNTHHLIQQATIRFSKNTVKETTYFKWFMDAKAEHKRFLHAMRKEGLNSTFSFEKARLNYIRVSRVISSDLSKSLVSFDYYLIIIGLSLMIMATTYTLIFLFFTMIKYQLHSFSEKRQILMSLGMAVIINTWCHYMGYIDTSSNINKSLLTISIATCFYIGGAIIRAALPDILKIQPTMIFTLPLQLHLVACFVFHLISLTSSSYIEEEHQTWYYLGTTILILLFIVIFRSKVCKASNDTNLDPLILHRSIWAMRMPLLMLVVVAVLRRLNQTGDKWRHLQDFGDFLNKLENKIYLSSFFAIGLITLLVQISKHTNSAQVVTSTLAGFFIYCYRGMNGTVCFFSTEYYHAALILPCFWLSVGLSAAIGYKYVIRQWKYHGYKSKSNLVTLLQTNLACSLLIDALLHKPHNVILLPAMLFTLDESYKLCDFLYFKTQSASKQQHVLVHKTLLTIFLAKMFYFYQGNSNSLATIDLTPGYIGQSSYNPLAVVVFVTLNTFCSHIKAFMFLILHVFETQHDRLPQYQQNVKNAELVQNNKHDLHLVISLYTVSKILPLTFYFCLLLVFRYHLFIYTVFSPKAFYECFSVFVFYLHFSITILYLKIV